MLCMDAPVTGDLYALQLALAGELVALVDLWDLVPHGGHLSGPWWPPVWPREGF